eukprot:363868-Chlamydomonas_euryale.AAC.1
MCNVGHWHILPSPFVAIGGMSILNVWGAPDHSINQYLPAEGLTITRNIWQQKANKLYRRNAKIATPSVSYRWRLLILPNNMSLQLRLNMRIVHVCNTMAELSGHGCICKS